MKAEPQEYRKKLGVERIELIEGKKA